MESNFAEVKSVSSPLCHRGERNLEYLGVTPTWGESVGQAVSGNSRALYNTPDDPHGLVVTIVTALEAPEDQDQERRILDTSFTLCEHSGTHE